MFCSRCGTNVQDGSKFCPSCGLDLAVQTPLGRTTDTAPQELTELDMVQQALAEEYEIQKELGRGGMAIVFKAKEKLLDREVAVKVLPFSLAFDAEFVERFQREARTAARLEHPSIIPIYRVGKSGRVIYFVMKYLRGTSLSDIIEQKGPMKPAEIRKILVQTASALGYAHKNDIVHRDIKPDNIMFDEMGHAVVTDFGIAKAATGTKLTGTGMSIGTPHYMSPEQAKAQSLDGRSDIYSLGVVAYQCLTGHVPFDGEDAFSIGYKHIMEEMPTPAHLPTAEHRKLLGIIRRMMAKSADERYQNAEELVATLEGKGAAVPDPDEAPTIVEGMSEAATVAMPSLGRTSRVPTPAGAVRPSTPTTPMPRAVAPPPPPKKKRSGLLAASVVLLVLGGGGAGGYFYVNSSLCPSQPENPVCAMLPGITPAAPTPAVPADTARPMAVADTATADSATPDSVRDTTAPAGADSGALAMADSMGVLLLRGVPSGARVRIGADAELSQPRSRYELPVGTHRIGVVAAGYEDWSSNVSVPRRDSTVLDVRMTREVVAQCDNPIARETYNLNNACFDRAARFQGTPQVDVSSVQGELPPTIVVYAQLSADGSILRVLQGSSRQDMERWPALGQVIPRALQHVQSAGFSPATKGGRNVEAWGQALIRLTR